ncbi:MAG TPA: hypothetical protein VM165_09120, partial [Planctomycetaceae bacterium]|nr:hypothetical protein [Planctomycetaceae bacterium]
MIVWQWLSHPWAVAVTAALLHFLWQGTLLALFGMVMVRCLRLATPHARYAAWMAVFAAMAATPVVTLLMLDHPSNVRSSIVMDTATLPASSLLDENDNEYTGGNAVAVVTDPETDAAMWPVFVGWAVPTAVSGDLVG